MSLDAMKQALHTLEGWANHGDWVWPESALEQAKRNTTESITALRAAIEQAQEPVAFDHGIGIDRFKVVRGAFWWHVLIGDSPTEHGKFRSRVSAETMAADLLREFRNGAFVQHTTPQPRQWQGLTADEIWDAWCEQSKPERDTRNFVAAFARAIEAKLREKNT